jgi:hypothetical protein
MPTIITEAINPITDLFTFLLMVCFFWLMKKIKVTWQVEKTKYFR